MKLKPLVIAGPTASGKTAAALAIAQRIPSEIISVDSALVYRGMDIGTAKPTATELASVAHHLINIRDPLQAYSAAEFVRDAHVLIEEIQARGKLPLLVGGTMLYIKALMDGIDDMPAADAALRAAIEAQAQELGWPTMHAQLMQVDPITAQRLSPNDSQRIQRALEVFQASGQALSSFHTAQKNTGRDDLTLISLEPHDRAWLHQRIAQRFELMMQQGLLNEVEQLRARGDLHVDLPSMRCVGYRQSWEALEGVFPMQELPERGIAATRQLAKRQITWLRSMPQRQIVPCDAPEALTQVMTLAQTHLSSGHNA